MGHHTTRRELWDKLDNESARAYEAFKCYLYMPPPERSILASYRIWSDNPDAKYAGGGFKVWSMDFAWEDRAKSYDLHIEHLRRRGHEKGLEEEARKKGREAERRFNNLSEILQVAYVKTMDFLEDMDANQIRFSDVVQVARLHIEHADKFGTGDQTQAADGDWEEDDDEFAEEIMERVKRRRAQGVSGGDDSERAEEGLPPA